MSTLQTTPDTQAARALQVAQRVHAIEPFRVMEMVKAAADLRRAGNDVISMSVGEPISPRPTSWPRRQWTRSAAE